MNEPKTTAAQRKAVKKYKEKVNRITVDFYPTESDLWDHINQQPKKQTYIKDLIRKDAAIASGKWIEWYPPMHMILTGEEMLYRCSECDAKYPDIEGYKHCPHCGRLMERSEKDV